MLITLLQRIQLAVGLLVAIVRYFWIVKEDRSKDKAVIIPIAAIVVIFVTGIKSFTFHLNPYYFLCREDT